MDSDGERQSRLSAMEEQRDKAEKEGRWIEAQEWNNRIRDFKLRQNRRLQKESMHAFDADREELLGRQETEVAALVEVWALKMAEYETQAKELIEYVRKKHAETEEAKVEEIRRQVAAKKLVPSKNVLLTRTKIDRLLKQRLYLEADELRSQLELLEQEEERKFQEDQRAVCKKKETAVRLANENEMNALRQRVKSGRRELRIQRKQDLERLLQAHQNMLRQLEQRSRLHHSRTRAFVSRQLSVLDSSLGSPSTPARTASPRPSSARKSKGP